MHIRVVLAGLMLFGQFLLCLCGERNEPINMEKLLMKKMPGFRVSLRMVNTCFLRVL